MAFRRKCCERFSLTRSPWLAQAFREWETSGHMPETVTMTLVTLLPKKETEERPYWPDVVCIPCMVQGALPFA